MLCLLGFCRGLEIYGEVRALLSIPAYVVAKGAFHDDEISFGGIYIHSYNVVMFLKLAFAIYLLHGLCMMVEWLHVVMNMLLSWHMPPHGVYILVFGVFFWD